MKLGSLAAILGCLLATGCTQQPAGSASGDIDGATIALADGPSRPGPKQGKCPICGEGVDGNTCHAYDAKCIYFCSFPCIDRFNKSPAEHMKRMREAGIALEDESSCEHLKGNRRPEGKGTER